METRKVLLEHVRKRHRYQLPFRITFVQVGNESVGERFLPRNVSTSGLRFSAKSMPPISILEELLVSFDPAAGTPKEASLPSEPIKALVVRLSTLQGEEGGIDISVRWLDEQNWVRKMADLIAPRPSSPWLCPKHEEAIVRLAANYPGCVSRGSLDRWLSQFELTERDPLIRMLTCLLANYYFSEEHCRRLCIEMGQRLLGLDGVQGHPSRVLVVPVGPPSKSGGIISYMLRVGSGLRFGFEDHSFKDRLLAGDSGVRERLQRAQWLVLLDDFLGTGRTVKDEIQKMKKGLRIIRMDGKNLAVATLVGYRGAIEAVEKEGITVIVPKNTILGDAEALRSKGRSNLSLVREDIENIRAACKSKTRLYRSFRGIEMPFGYNNNGSLVVFYYNTPNNSLPILWSREPGWFPLFPRRHAPKPEALRPMPMKQIQVLDSEDCAGRSSTFREILTRLEAKSNVLITGPSGAGKSELAEQIARQLESQGKTVYWHTLTESCSAEAFLSKAWQFVAQLKPANGPQANLDGGFPAVSLKESAHKLAAVLNDVGVTVFVDNVDTMLTARGDREARGQRLRDVLDIIVRKSQGDFALVFIEKKASFTDDNKENRWMDRFVSVALPGLSYHESIQLLKVFGLGEPNGERASQAVSRPLPALRLGLLAVLHGSKGVRTILQKASDDASGLDKLIGKHLGKLSKTQRKCIEAICILAGDVSEREILALVGKQQLGLKQVQSTLEKLVGTKNQKAITPLLIKLDNGLYRTSSNARNCVYQSTAEDIRERYNILAGAQCESSDVMEEWQQVEAIRQAHFYYIRGGSALKATDLLLRRQRFLRRKGRVFLVESLADESLTALTRFIENSRTDETLSKRAHDLRGKVEYILIKAWRERSEHKATEERTGTALKKKQFGSDDLTEAHFHLARAAAQTCSWNVTAASSSCLDALDVADRAIRKSTSLDTSSSNDKTDIPVAETKAKAILRRAQTETYACGYENAWLILEEALNPLGVLKDKAQSAFWHGLSVLCDHVSTLLCLEESCHEALGWASTGYQLNRDLGDVRGKAILLYRRAQCWFKLKAFEEAHSDIQEALSYIRSFFPYDLWWCSCFLLEQSRISAFMSRQPGGKRFMDEYELAMKELQGILNERRDSGKIDWMAPHVFETYLVEAEQCYLLRKHQDGDQKWLEALAFLRKHRYQNVCASRLFLLLAEDLCQRNEPFHSTAKVEWGNVNMPATDRLGQILWLSRISANLLNSYGLFQAQFRPLSLLVKAGQKVLDEKELPPEVTRTVGLNESDARAVRHTAELEARFRLCLLEQLLAATNHHKNDSLRIQEKEETLDFDRFEKVRGSAVAYFRKQGLDTSGLSLNLKRYSVIQSKKRAIENQVREWMRPIPEPTFSGMEETPSDTSPSSSTDF